MDSVSILDGVPYSGGYELVQVDRDQKHLVAVEVATIEEDGTILNGDIFELHQFVVANKDDPDLWNWLDYFANGHTEVYADGGAFGEHVLRPIYQPHIIE